MKSTESTLSGQVDAVYEAQLEGFLTNIGLYDEFREGLLKCTVCGETVTKDNLYGFFVHHGRAVAVCNRPSCIEKAFELRRNELKEPEPKQEKSKQ